jgi:hypothetical protein
MSLPADVRVRLSQDLGDKWPFTVESGAITCPDPQEVVFEANGRKYALNDDNPTGSQRRWVEGRHQPCR